MIELACGYADVVGMLLGIAVGLFVALAILLIGYVMSRWGA